MSAETPDPRIEATATEYRAELQRLYDELVEVSNFELGVLRMSEVLEWIAQLRRDVRRAALLEAADEIGEFGGKTAREWLRARAEAGEL